MSDTVFCRECETEIPANARFCHSCGAGQESVLEAASPEAPPSEHRSLFRTPPAPEQTSEAEAPTAAPPPAALPAPGAGELAGELVERLRTPGVMAAGIVGAFALITCLVVGLIAAVASPDRTIIGFFHSQDGIFTETLRMAVATTLAVARIDGETNTQLLPLIFGVAPFFGAALGARRAAPLLTGLSTRGAVAWSAAGAVVFAAGMMILALVANGQGGGLVFGLDFSIGSVLLLSLLLAGAGAAFGAWRGARTVAPDRPDLELPVAVSRLARIVATPLLGLAALLAVSAVVSFVHLEVHTIRGQVEAVTTIRSDIGAAVENILFAADLGIDTAGMAVLGQFDSGVLTVADDKRDDFEANLDDDGKGRIFAYSGALPIYVFIPELLILLGTALAASLYSGFATARRAAPATQLVAAGWGALTGIVWALALVLLRTLAFGQSTIADSVFASALLLGTVLGAIGGVLAFAPRTPAVASPKGPASP